MVRSLKARSAHTIENQIDASRVGNSLARSRGNDYHVARAHLSSREVSDLHGSAALRDDLTLDRVLHRTCHAVVAFGSTRARAIERA